MRSIQMSEITAFRVKNLRSLSDTAFIDLKPITILVGRNSAGKSTFARVLPLIRQTVEVRKRSPMLWWGRLVDFGSFADSVNRNSDPREIEFGFRVTLDRAGELIRDSSSGVTVHGLRPQIVEVTLRMVEDAGTHETRLSEIQIKKGKDNFLVQFSSGDRVDKIIVNSYTWIPPPEKERQEITYESLIPTIHFFENRTIKSADGNVIASYRTDLLQRELISFFYGYSLVHGNTSWESVADLCRQLDPEDENRLLVLMQNAGAGLPSWVSAVAGMTVDDWRFARLRDRLLAAQLDTLLVRVDEAISNTVSRCAYIEPLRATAERYYRKQGLSVAEVDSKGANVPFFLDSLSTTERERFDAWMFEHFDAGIKTSSDGGHLSIKLKDASGNETNLADVGFGFSQVLPVALQLWSATQRTNRPRAVRRRAPPSVVVIEQPELHLHPEYQAKIGDLLKSTIEAGNVCLVVETHSSSIINRLGSLVASGELKSEKIQILRFEKTEPSKATEVAVSEFDEKGILKNWPYGFFDA